MGQIGFPVKQVTPKDIIGCEICFSLFLLIRASNLAQPVKSNLNEKLDQKEKTIQAFNIDAQGLRKTRNENPPRWKIGATS